MRIIVALALSACIVVQVGCFSAGPATRFYSLQPVAGPVVVTASAGAPIGVESVDLPPALDGENMVVYLAPYRVEMRGVDRWAAPLEAMVPHVLAFDLAERLPEGELVLRGEPRPAEPVRSLVVIVERFAAGPELAVVLEARWSLGPDHDAPPGILRRERVTVAVASMEGDAIAAGMSAALGALADRIVARVAGPAGRGRKGGG